MDTATWIRCLRSQEVRRFFLSAFICVNLCPIVFSTLIGGSVLLRNLRNLRLLSYFTSSLADFVAAELPPTITVNVPGSTERFMLAS